MRIVHYKGDSFASLHNFATLYLTNQHLIHGRVFSMVKQDGRGQIPPHPHWITAGIYYNIIPT